MNQNVTFDEVGGLDDRKHALLRFIEERPLYPSKTLIPSRR